MIKIIDKIRFKLFDEIFLAWLFVIPFVCLTSEIDIVLFYLYLFIIPPTFFISLFFIGDTRTLSINELKFIENDAYLSKEFKKFLNKKGTRIKIGFFFSLKKYKSEIMKTEENEKINRIKKIGDKNESK